MNSDIVTEVDRELFARELASFVPTRVFDAHAHWYSTENFLGEDVPRFSHDGIGAVGADIYRAAMAALLPERVAGGLFFPFPSLKLDLDTENTFIADELKSWPAARGQLLVTPAMDPERIRQAVREGGFTGLKCYHIYSSHEPSWESTIEGFLPEAHARIAHELGLTITLHIVRSRALADTANQETIRRYSAQYPNLRLILAHAARGFNPHHTLAGIDALRGLDNVWFDTSAVTDAGAIEAIARVMGHERLLYGSDFPVSHVRGRCVALGDSFLWLSAHNIRLDAAHGKVELSLVGLESLRTLKIAAMSLNLSDAEVEDVFCGNASRLFALP